MKPCTIVEQATTEIKQAMDALIPSHQRRVDSIKSNICAWCGCDAKTFSDSLSQKEYSISGLCQACQDKTFVEGENK